MKKVHFLFLLLCLLYRANLCAQKNNNVVLVLPFCTKLTMANPNHSYIQLANLSREYYQGMRIALDSLQKNNIALNITVLDTENDSLVLVKLLKKQAMKDAQLIIGPILKGGNKIMGDFVKGKDAFHVSPLMTFVKPDADDANTIAANPYINAYGKLIIDHLKKREQSDSFYIIVVSDKSTLDKNITASLKSSLPKKAKLKIVDADKLTELTGFLSSAKTNHIIIPSSSEKVVGNFYKSVKDTSLFRTMVVYGLPQWLDFKNPNYLLWQQANTCIGTPYFIDYDREDVKAFMNDYRKAYFTDPTEAAFKGYDQTLLLISQLNLHGKRMLSKLEEQPQQTLHTTFNFKKLDDKGGYQNYYLNWIGLQDLKWILE